MIEQQQEAQRLYRQALERDPRNLGARVNLARLLAEAKASDAALEEAIQLLTEVERSTRDRPKETARYAAMYSLAIAQFDLGYGEDDGGVNRLCREALAMANKLKEEVEQRRGGGAGFKPNPVHWFQSQTLQAYCDALYPAVEALWVGLTLLLGADLDPAESEEIAKAGGLLTAYIDELGHPKKLPTSPRALYNRACTLSLAAGLIRERDPVAEERLVQGAFVYLELVVNEDPALARSSEEGGSFIDRDRSLTYLREARPQRYGKLLEPFRVPAPPPVTGESALAKLKAVPAERVAQLEELGVTSWQEFLCRLLTTRDRSTFAGELGVRDEILLRWALLLDLLRIDGLSVDDLNLLDRAQIHSRDQLVAADPDRLTALLVDLVGTDEEHEAPEKATVALWWVTARRDPCVIHA